MRKLSKEKKNQLILVGLATAIVLAGLWFTLISMQRRQLKTLATIEQKDQKEFATMQEAIKNRKQLDDELAKRSDELGVIEEEMVSGDPYAWMVNKLREFKLPYKVEVPQFSTVVVAKNTMLPKFPYKQVTISIAGSGYFHDLGRFIADLENQFPYMRVQNLDVQPISGLVSEDREKLSFRMDVIALIKPSAS